MKPEQTMGSVSIQAELAMANDGGKTFNQIAKMIERLPSGEVS